VRAALDAKTAALSELDQMIGIDSVKKQISGLCDVAIYDEMQRVNGVEPEPATHHMLFLGNPDTGKTTVAKIVSKMLKEIGIVTKDTVKMYDNARTALVDGVVGGTALKAQRSLKAHAEAFFSWTRRVTSTCTQHTCTHAARSLTLTLTLTLPFTGVLSHSHARRDRLLTQEAIGELLSKSEEYRADTVMIRTSAAERLCVHADHLLPACLPAVSSASSLTALSLSLAHRSSLVKR